MKNQNRIHSLFEVASIIFVLLFTSVGCELKQGKLADPAIPTESAEQTQSLNKAAPAASEAQELGVKIERNVPVPMRDGTILRADIHRPDHGGPYPVLVRRTPHGKGGNFNQLVKAGYIVVSQDARGWYESEGEFESMGRPKTHDAEDGYDTIKWAAKLPGSSSKVGTFGGSYNALLQWRLAPLRPPSLVAMSAWSIPAYRSGEGTGSAVGAPFRLQRQNQMATHRRRKANLPGVHTAWEANKLWKMGEPEKWINWLPWNELPNDFFGYPADPAYSIAARRIASEPRSLDEGCKNISVPNLDVVGWYDHANGDMLLFRTMVEKARTEVARKGSRIIIGPWDHTSLGRRGSGTIDFGPDAAFDIDELRIRWFDYWLKGKQNGVEKEAPVKIFVMGDNRWRDEQHWPLQRTKEKILFITSNGQANTPSGNGKLGDEKPQSLGIDNYVYDPRDPVPTPYEGRPKAADWRPLANRQDILVYQTEPLTERIEVTGNPIVELYAASSAPDTDWFVRLIDVAPDGLARDVSSAMIRARHRDGSDKPKLIKPNEVVRYTIRMRPTSNAFLPGHRIRLDITSSDFPVRDRNHNTAADQNADATLVTAKQTIYHGGERATRIILPWMPNPIEEDKGEPDSEKQIYHLHQAVEKGDIEQVKQLISKRADVNAKDEKENTPLCYAVTSGKMEVIQLLLEAGADVNAGSWPPLCVAVDENNVAIAEYLITHGANVNAPPEGWTALQQAPYIANNVKMIELLIANGADINAGPYTALHAAVQEDRLDIVELLIAKGANVDAKDKWHMTPLSSALALNRKDIAKSLLANGANFDSKDKSGLKALHNAAVWGYQEIAELILAKGAEVDERDDVYEFTALHYAARFGNKDVAEVLIANGANVKAKDKWDYQPIHWAAHHDRADVVELLISKGADVNAKTSLDQTPLQLAKPRRNMAAIEVLRKHGAKE